MPEPPDFDRIALTLRGSDDLDPSAADIVEQLRQVWNARGAADAEAVENRLATLTGWVTSEPYRQHLREAIESVNR